MTYPAGTIMLVNRPGLIPAGIRLFTRSPWNHAAVCLGDGWTVEAGPKGAFVGREANYTSGHYAVNPGVFTAPQRKLITDKARASIGVPYDYLDIALLAIHGITGRFEPHLKRVVDNSKSMICSQLAAVCWQAAGFDWGKDPSVVTPADIGNTKGTVTVQ